jgi:hypothetical protein
MPNRAERREAERQHRQAASPQSQHPSVEAKPAPAISEAQLAANRANALLSTGAVTEEGKMKSSMNALKHGLTGKSVLLPTDDAAEYQRKLDARLNAFSPATEEELRLVQSLVDCAWRLQRLQALETGIMLKGQIEFASKYADQSPARRAQLIDVDTYLKYEKSIRNLHIHEARLHRRLEKDQAELIRLQNERKREERFAAEQAMQPNPQPSSNSARPNGFDFSTAQRSEMPSASACGSASSTATSHH